MNGDDITGWTVDTLHEHIDVRIDSIYKLIDERQSANERDIEKSMAAAEKRFESINEFRAQLADQALTFMPRAEAQAIFKSVIDRLESQSKAVATSQAELRSRLDIIAGSSTGEDSHRLDTNRLITVIISAIAVAVAIYAVLKP